MSKAVYGIFQSAQRYLTGAIRFGDTALRWGGCYLILNSLANLFLLPDLVVGMPVAFDIFRLAFVIPNARFQLKDNPGILNLLFAINTPHHGLQVPQAEYPAFTASSLERK